ncbi:GNAT family N-acetyltransferase [Azoarcus sp. TTM-91]|uniref:GNAT family N-acetyltransferase n=1 Tax=Azoarcus sp. TTM-91 TaxID=2691581 RepID=UPI00145EC532|nr:GNAT family N-acetyltransferase [Azoarcus sp. TTM-91]NMG34416.1 GNAT family N-acetyltransferase [Azoarcus sp. TTM-91]
MVSFPLQIEPTRLDDPGHVQAFLALLDHYARDPMGGGKPLAEAVRAELPQRLAGRPGFVSFLAFSGPEAIGLINCFEGFSTFAARPLLNVHDIVVHAEHRGRGIAQGLLAAAEAEARARGCCKLTLEVLSNNQRALAAYDQAGFRPYVLDPAAGQALFLQKWL